MRKCIFCEHSVIETAVQCPHCGAALSPAETAASSIKRYQAQRPDDASWHGEVASLASQGRRIEAIKVFRERTGVGLAEAKAAVEALERGQPISIEPSRVPQGTSQEADLLDLLRQGQKIAAIKLYRERTGVGLREAKEAVERLAAQHDIPSGRAGCLGMILLAGGAVGMGCNWLF